MRILRRRFLATIGAVAATVLTFPAILRGQKTTSATQRKALDMEIKRVGTQASTKGPADWFTGTVRIDPLFRSGPCCWRKRHVRAGRAHRVAHASARTNADRDKRLRLGAT